MTFKSGDVVRVINEDMFKRVYGIREVPNTLFKVTEVVGYDNNRYCLLGELLTSTYYQYQSTATPCLELVSPEEAEVAFPTPKKDDLVWDSDSSQLGIFQGFDGNDAEYKRLMTDGSLAPRTSYTRAQHMSVVKDKTVQDFKDFPKFMKDCKAFTYKGNKDKAYLVLSVSDYRVTYINPEGWQDSFAFGSFWNFLMVEKIDNAALFEDPAIKGWGLTMDNFKEVFEGRDGYSFERMTEFLEGFCLKQYDPFFGLRLELFQPKPSAKVAGNVALFLNKSSSDKGIPVSMKAGRAFRAMFPWLTDKELEQAVDKFRIDFPVLNFKVQESTEVWAFKHAYSHTMSPYENIYTTSQRKSLANSCMRHDFSRMKTHPCEVYASGDFKMLWTEDDQGRIGSRCVVYLNANGKQPQAGPVYGTSENSIDILVEELQKMGAVYDCNASWCGARLNYVNDGHGVVGPYLDIEQSLARDGDYLVIGQGHEYEACSYGGYFSGGQGCDECGELIDEEDIYLDDDGHCYCESCYHDIYTRCDHSGDMVRQDETVSVWQSRRAWGGYMRNAGLVVHNSYTEDGTFLYCEDRDEYWHSDSVVVDAAGNTQHIDDVTLCEETDEYYSPDLLAECADGKYRNLDFLNENGWTPDSYGVYDLPKEEEESEAA